MLVRAFASESNPHPTKSHVPSHRWPRPRVSQDTSTSGATGFCSGEAQEVEVLRRSKVQGLSAAEDGRGPEGC